MNQQFQDQAAAPAQRNSIMHYLEDDRVRKGITAVAGKIMTPDRFLRLAVNAIKKTPDLAKCDPQSVLGALMASAALGLEPNTVQQQAFLIPYKKSSPRKTVNGDIMKGSDGKWLWDEIYECQFQIGYRGFITLAHRSPHIIGIQAEAIHDGDLFDHMLGSESFLKYRKSLKDRGSLIGAFCYTRLESGAEMATVLPLDEILKIRSKSETFNALERKVREEEGNKNQKDLEKTRKKLAETPWVMWEDDMSAKSAIKKHAKQLPLMPGDAISAAAALDSSADAGIVDMSAMTDPDVVRSVIDDGAEPPALEHQTPNELAADLANLRSAPEPERVAARQRTQSTTSTRATQQDRTGGDMFSNVD
ncbi:recombinase RecT [Pectobacterium brasiliense]|uniref:recombinase RecT n=1 Tax=Pectobacterium brasiliense TaxID=180957 RepID=UPI001D0D4FF9|nr:recombinase RecT [Pectobacterium brasiliense]UDQ77712.1 recombinase RecT [Pectobacterium brasiliense]